MRIGMRGPGRMDASMMTRLVRGHEIAPGRTIPDDDGSPAP